MLPNTVATEPITQRVQRIRQTIAEAARRAGRQAAEVTLVAVSKRQSPERIAEAAAAGIVDIGENYVQEALAKQEALAGLAVRWHLIGGLQSNKARLATGAFAVIQTVDRLSLARALDRHAAYAGRHQAVLVEVDLTGGAPRRSGVAPCDALALCEEIATLPHLELRGLMGIAPQGGDPRPSFAALRRLFEALAAQHRQVLSMGMSADYEAAVEEGATLVRIGTALFGQRPQP